ncbi:MAG: tetratricopeptide repeat protein [Acidobacteria bacterium]|nr:tetratricopeptide repeat protein [Acidobacteriota bacterium]
MIKIPVRTILTMLTFLFGTATLAAAQVCAILPIQRTGKPSEVRQESVGSIQDCREALDYFQKDLEMRRIRKDTIREAWALARIGGIYLTIKDWPKAFDSYERALPLFTEAKNRYGLWETLPGLAMAAREQKRFAEFMTYAEESAAFFRDYGDGTAKMNEALMYDKIAGVYIELGDETKALAYYEKSLKVGRDENSRWKQAETLTLMGRYYETKGRRLEAVEAYRTALDLYLEDNRVFPGARWDGQKIVPEERFTEEMKDLREAIERLQK